MAKPLAAIHGYYHTIGEHKTRWELWRSQESGLRWYKDGYPASDQMEQRLLAHIMGEKQEGAYFDIEKGASRQTIKELRIQAVAEAVTGGRELPTI